MSPTCFALYLAATVLEEERSVLKSTISTVYTRRGATETQGRRRNLTTTTKGKGKGKNPLLLLERRVALLLEELQGRPPGTQRSCFRKDSIAQDPRPISASAPCHGAKKKRPPPSTPKLPEDFVKKQRAYFAEVDAFDLPVEEVSDSELE
ncbi:hypothetical protein HU200_065230 [Digitaria exilis]|uniref:Sororin C-terminal region domain-containing protein n=1 Tax=Digitaria exilis TaxID=1010633 RepID=A0A835A205_9POAL|nr:hypothetical protein HU200_065230 [Digitaria exilis]